MLSLDPDSAGKTNVVAEVLIIGNNDVERKCGFAWIVIVWKNLPFWDYSQKRDFLALNTNLKSDVDNNNRTQ
jgi:hypothetical protein